MFNRSERLFLRPAWPEDWQEIYPLINDCEVVRNLVSAPWPYTPDDARAFVARTQPLSRPNFLVTLPETAGGRIVGSAGLIDAECGEVELGYWIARDHWGQGFATEAARAVLQVARALGHRKVIASHFVDNPASGRVLRKAGFRPTGELKPRNSRARGAFVPAHIYAVTLGGPGDCEPCDDGDHYRPIAA